MSGARLNHGAVRFMAESMSDGEIAGRLKCYPGYVRLIRTRQVLTVAERRAAGIKSKSRIVKPALNPHKARRGLSPDHPAVLASKTVYPLTVRDPDGDRMALKRGTHNAKIGDVILKGKWKGYRVYTLTLEERATCPDSCHHWVSCFGNHMNRADRLRHGPELETKLRQEVRELCLRHPGGVAVRLHVLGDFYSVEYIRMWAELLEKYPRLVVFGFSAQWQNTSNERGDIAGELMALVSRKWKRFAIRFSNAPFPRRSTISIETADQIGNRDAILCPQQTGKTESCSTCALCWQSQRPIAFLLH